MVMNNETKGSWARNDKSVKLGPENPTKKPKTGRRQDLRLNLFGEGAQVSKLLPALASWDMVQEQERWAGLEGDSKGHHI